MSRFQVRTARAEAATARPTTGTSITMSKSKCLDHEKRPLCHDSDVDDLVGELQQRKEKRSFLHSETQGSCCCTQQAQHHQVIHTGRDAAQLGPDDRERNTARGAESQAKPTLHMPLPESTTSERRVLSFWSISEMMPSILGLATPEGNKTRGAS